VGAIESTIDEILDATAARPCRVILVDDGSSDATARVIEARAVLEPQLSLIRHRAILGYGASIKSGIRSTADELIVITDAGGTYPNVRIPELVDACENAEMVVGARVGENVQYSKLRAIPKLFLNLHASWIARQKIPDLNSGLRVSRRSIAERYMRILPDSLSFTTTITLCMLTNAYRGECVPISNEKRVGKSTIRPIRDSLRFAQLIMRTGMYFAPMRVLFPLVLALAAAFLASVCYDLFVLSNLTDKTVLPFLFCMNVALFGLLSDMIDKRVSK